MKALWTILVGLVAAVLGPVAALAEPALTVYNQNFGVVRETIRLDLTAGVNRIPFNDITARLEPDSVILRDPTGQRRLQILEQNYRADPVSQGLLLSLYEGQTIGFLVRRGDVEEIVHGKIIRSGYLSPSVQYQRYGYPQPAPGQEQSIIEVDGQLRFGLPGIPLFPALADDAILKPTLDWVIETDQTGPIEAELAYVTDGMTWEASYNLVAPEKGDVLNVVGWVTVDNQSGKTFENARLKLMAGDVSRIRRVDERRYEAAAMYARGGPPAAPPPVTEKTFEEYHLYTVQRPTTLHDRETKQIEFLRAADVAFTRYYVYDGAKIEGDDWRRRTCFQQEQDYGTLSNPKVWAMCEFENKEANGLGVPLPKGRTRFYRQDEDGQLEFTGENVIDHTPKDETVRVYIGSAFDLVGERLRTDYKVDHSRRLLDESFEIKLRNRKAEPVEIRVVEHLYRGMGWEITESSNIFKKMESQTIEFRVQVQPDEEKVLTYSVHYMW